MARILLIDDDAGFREVLTFTLQELDHEVESFESGERGLAGLKAFEPDVVLTDLKMPGMGGVDVVRRVKEIDADLPVIVVTAFGTIEDAVEVMKLGADDYVTKPYNRDELKLTIDQALERRRLRDENRTLRHRLRESARRTELIHVSPVMESVVQKIRRIATTDATVLITGESGVGKEVVAKTLHAHSDRWERPFVAVNCAAIPRDLMESELFGHVRGAFTGAVRDKPGRFMQASGGTLLLDEVADLPEDLQAKLLRVIETGEVDVIGDRKPVAVDVRLVAATNADLERRVKAGRFREDLFYRLNVIPVHIPPLRERREDIPALWEHFVQTYAKGAAVRSSPGLIRKLMERPWPGNVRELANLCQRMVLLRDGDVLDEIGLGLEMPSDATDGESERREFLGTLPDDGLSLPDLEREVIVRALAKHGGNRTRTAEYLGIPRHVLVYRIEKYRIT